MTRYNAIVITDKNLAQYRASHGNWVRVGYTVQVPIDESVDLRPFGQLRTWLFNDPPPLQTCGSCGRDYDAQMGHECPTNETND
jgi:hypothetical protein